MELDSIKPQTLSGLLHSKDTLSILTTRSNQLAKLMGESCLTAEKLKTVLIVSDSGLLSNAFSLIIKGINSQVENTIITLDYYAKSKIEALDGYDSTIMICHDSDMLNKFIKAKHLVESKVFLIAPGSLQLKALSEMGVDIAVSLESNANDIRDAFLRGISGETFSTGFIDTLEEKYPHLTGRQKEVLKLICAGKSNKEIARDLNIALSTIKTHCAAIFKELGVMNRTQAVLILG
jgi:DNA-binding CsgD family transcriptional regulator